jgi:N-acetylmuramoyl-L-alanine amidase
MMFRIALLCLGMAGLARSSIGVSDTLVGKSPWLVLEGRGKSLPRLKVAGDAATIELASGGTVEARNGKASLVIEGKSFAMVPAPRVVGSKLLLPRKEAQKLLEAQFTSEFLCEEDGCHFAGSGDVEVKSETKVVSKQRKSDPDPPKQAKPTKAEVVKPQVKDEEQDSPPVTTPKRKPSSWTVVVDAGHGGKDPGAHGVSEDGKTIREKDVTLAVAKKLRDQLVDEGYKVVMTRDDDHFEELKARTVIANRAKGNLFISLHCNAVPAHKETTKGFRVYLLREAQSAGDKAIERRENEAIRLESSGKDVKRTLSPIEWMQIDHQLNQFTKESERFSGMLVKNLQKQAPVTREHTGAGQAGFFVLVGAMMPSVLIEMGYVSHPQEMLTLSDPVQQNRIASAITQSVKSFTQSRSTGK